VFVYVDRSESWVHAAIEEARDEGKDNGEIIDEKCELEEEK